MTRQATIDAVGDLLSPALSIARSSASLPNSPLQAQALESLTRYLELLESWNERMDLVAPAPRPVLIERHLVDCLVAGELTFARTALRQGSSVLDVGSGAGLPGLIWAICFPFQQLILCEPREKRGLFLKEARRVLGLQNVEVVTSRFDEIAKSGRTFALITTRALGQQQEFLRHSAHALEDLGWIALFVGSEFAELPPERPGLTEPQELHYRLPQDTAGRGRRVVLWQKSNL